MVDRYNTGDSRPSNSMKNLSDNALAFDDFMNSENDTFIDRLENEKDTLAGAQKKMAAAAEASVQDTRQNLIPLSRQYATLAAAQADIVNIPVGSATYYRSPDDSALAIEVINNGGTLEPTGRKMPSQAEIDDINTRIFYGNDGDPFIYKQIDATGNIIDIIFKNGESQRMGERENISSGVDEKITGVKTYSQVASIDDSTGGSAIAVTPDGMVWLRGLAIPIQQIYAIKNQSQIAQAIKSIAEIEADGLPQIRRTFYATDKSGALTTQSLLVSRVTKNTGFTLNSWPQGKVCHDSTGRIYVGYNHASAHGSSDQLCALRYSDDEGKTWSDTIEPIASEGKARGSDWWALGCDSADHLWGIIRSRGTNNAQGVTAHNIYMSTDRGVTWSKIGEIPLTQTISGTQYVPELYHDLLYYNGRMYTGYHFSNSSRMGFLSFDISDPLNTITTFDAIADGAYPTTKLVEPTLGIDLVQDGTGYIYGGIRTQDTAYPSKFYFMRPDFSGFTMYNAPENVIYSGVVVKRINGMMVALFIERYNTGTMNLWFGTPSDFYSSSVASFYKMKIGQILNSAIPSGNSTNVGVQGMDVIGNNLVMAWSTEDEAGNSDTFFAVMNVVQSESYMTLNYLESF